VYLSAAGLLSGAVRPLSSTVELPVVSYRATSCELRRLLESILYFALTPLLTIGYTARPVPIAYPAALLSVQHSTLLAKREHASALLSEAL
jgi:hypothetical protein